MGGRILQKKVNVPFSCSTPLGLLFFRELDQREHERDDDGAEEEADQAESRKSAQHADEDRQRRQRRAVPEIRSGFRKLSTLLTTTPNASRTTACM